MPSPTWASDVAAEIDRLIVAVYEATAAVLATSWPFPNAHPALMQGIGSALLNGPVARGGLRATYPYLPEPMLAALVQNNIDEGVISLDDDEIGLTDAGRAQAERAHAQFHDTAAAMWQRRDLEGLERAMSVAVEHARALAVLVKPSAFAVQAPLVDQLDTAARLFRQLTALRYWRADAHVIAWITKGLHPAEAHALNLLWDKDRGVVRVGQGHPKPAQVALIGLEANRYIDSDRITDAGRALREAIENETNTQGAIPFETLDDAAKVFVIRRLREIPSS